MVSNCPNGLRGTVNINKVLVAGGGDRLRWVDGVCAGM